ncbi:peptide-methionine (S)-S-oxide reductase MsrA [Roseospira visakhapatnamensis]|uniref:Peptide methionine sulfoxide reductase MsrA n=1 Tax=Roseospira visakhapatnamensis TaxID=390880 RepID=A0A7W6WBE2_9PROT|nr:peptide-methionine (S)-S-oxide reductase MsrA [Roseospira visakhapatnamensis]MBB4267452.1 peptide-methionine (S)-S-oxide reductase [Roseospira visakhapatnamensis]
MTTRFATFGAGCFWGVELAFRNTDGVVDTTVGYAGGHRPEPTYEMVCTGTTGHAEVVRVEYDPSVVDYDGLLAVFWACHDPTQVDRQGPDIGSQYRSLIQTHDAAQAEAAAASRQALAASGRVRRPIATILEPAGPFWPAEDYHQRYLERRGRAACGAHLRSA